MGQVIVGVDIGTSKVCTLIGEIIKDNQIEILGKGIEPCNGVKKGVIVDIETTANSIRNSIRQAGTAANLNVASAFVNISAANVSIINKRNQMSTSGESHEITVRDKERLLYTAGDIEIPEDMQIIDIIPIQYIVDGYDQIVDPVGMVGTNLEVEVDIVAGKITSVQNIIKSMERADVKVDGLVVEALATGEAALTPDEKEMGVLLIDIGGGITEISVFKNRRLIFCDSIPVGGDHITNDIAIGLRIPYNEAEKLKRQYELALTSLIKNDQEIMVSEISENGKKNVKISELVEIIEARVYEIFALTREMLVKANINESDYAGVVLCGAGISYIDGGVQLAGEVFNIPVRVAVSKQLGISRIEHLTAAGILRYVAANRRGRSIGSEVRVIKPLKPVKSAEKVSFASKLANVLRKFF